MSGYTRWQDIRAEHVARAGGEAAMAAGKQELLNEMQTYRDSVINSADRTAVTRPSYEPVVTVHSVEHESIRETEYLLRDPNNAATLRRSIGELERNEIDERDLTGPAAV